jgi:hypothetical protein
MGSDEDLEILFDGFSRSGSKKNGPLGRNGGNGLNGDRRKSRMSSSRPNQQQHDHEVSGAALYSETGRSFATVQI